jgi:hypothetical protein
MVAHMVSSDKKLQRRLSEHPRLQFDFLVGGLEVDERDLFLKLRDLLPILSDSLMLERLKRVEQVWSTSFAQGFDDLADLRQWAACVGWESIESKVALDEARAQAAHVLRNNDRITARNIDAVVSTSATSFRAAQYAGTLRRAIGSLIIQSLWLPNPAEAKAVLRSAIALTQEDGALEPTLVSALAWAWTRLFNSSSEAFEEVVWHNPPSPDERHHQQIYWRPFAPPK